jgi:hypothetical protein
MNNSVNNNIVLLISNNNYLNTINNILQYSEQSTIVLDVNDCVKNDKKKIFKKLLNKKIILDVEALKMLESFNIISDLNCVQKIILVPHSYNITSKLQNSTYINLPNTINKILNVINK